MSDLESEIDLAINLIKDKVGGETSDAAARSTSFEAIDTIFSRISNTYFDDFGNKSISRLYSAFMELSKAKMLKAFTEHKKEALSEYLKKIDALLTADSTLDRSVILTETTPITDKLTKISKLISNRANPVSEDASGNDESEKILKSTGDLASSTLIDFYNRVFSSQKKVIDNVPPTPEGGATLEIIKRLLDIIDTDRKLQVDVKKKENEISKEAAKDPRKDASLVRDKHRIVRRLVDAMSLSKLPAISEGKVTSGGDYYQLFTQLEKQNASSMKDAVNRTFKNSIEAETEFKNRAVREESALEEDQLSYLTACRSWIHGYIVNAKNGGFNQREVTNAITRLDSIYTEKTKEIKNYYLAKDFNLGNFGGLQLKPEIRLPLYTKVKLAVSEEDRVKESPLRNLLSGLGQVMAGIFGAIPDRKDPAVIAAGVAQDRAIFAGISSIVKAVTSVVGGKQAARDYEEKIEKPVSKFAYGKDKAGVKEDMLSVADASGHVPINPEAPGQMMQTPAVMVPNNMDKMALAGPGKKKKGKKESVVVPGSKVMNFSEFLSRKA
jgi:hypothetical protein